MSEYFGPCAVKLAGTAARLLGWLPDDFWSATPAELSAVLSPPEASGADSLNRAELKRLMEKDDA